MATLAQKIKQNKKKQSLNKPATAVESKENSQDYVEVSVSRANQMWIDIKKRVKDDAKFVELNDNEKIEIYQKSEYKDFYTEFPIVCRYMICMGQFSNKAFKKYLTRCKSVKHDPVESKVKGYTEDQWVRRQSDYVRYLWESYQRQHFNQDDARAIWQHAYKTLKQEFQDFKDMHADIEQKLEKTAKTNKSELVKEMLTRLSNKDQELDENTTKNLLEKLKTQLYRQRSKNLINSINNDVPVIPPTRMTRGSRKELKPSDT